MDAIYPLISRLSQELSHSRRTVVAIDGPCASGKTTLAFNLIEMFGGSVIAENVFSYPGLGSAVSEAGLSSDVPLLLGITLFSALFVCAGNMIANLLYGVMDPQMREVGE